MDQEKQPTRLKPLYPPAEFWRALLAVRLHLFAVGLDVSLVKSGAKHEGSLLHSVDVVDNHLVVAIDEGWLDDWL
jgi:hypothetical protein